MRVMRRICQPEAVRADCFGREMEASRRRMRSRFVPDWRRLWARVMAPQT